MNRIAYFAFASFPGRQRFSRVCERFRLLVTGTRPRKPVHTHETKLSYQPCQDLLIAILESWSKYDGSSRSKDKLLV